MIKDFDLASRYCVLIWETNYLEWNEYPSLQEEGGTGLAQTPVHAVLLDRDYSARFSRRFEHRRFVQRFYRMQAKDTALNTFLC
jgi:hypothetical protein